MHGEVRGGVGRAEIDAFAGALDACQLARRPVAGDLAQLHPQQVFESRVQTAHHVLPYLEAQLLSVPIHARPVREGERRFATLDDIHHAPGLTIGSDELVRAADWRVVPAAGPITCATDDAHDAARIGRIEIARILDTRSDALLALAIKVAEVVRNLGLENIAQGFVRRLGELRQRLVAESAGCRDAFTREPDVLQDAQRVGEIVSNLVGAAARGPLPVLHELQRVIGLRVAGLRIDDAGVRDHLGVDVPVRHHQRADELQAVVQLALRPAG